MTMKPPPPGPATNGIVTPIAAAVATAASTALPPLFSTAMPARLAFRSIEATAPPVPTATGCLPPPAAAGPGAALASDGRPPRPATSANVTETVTKRRCIGTSRHVTDEGGPPVLLVLPAPSGVNHTGNTASIQLAVRQLGAGPEHRLDLRSACPGIVQGRRNSRPMACTKEDDCDVAGYPHDGHSLGPDDLGYRRPLGLGAPRPSRPGGRRRGSRGRRPGPEARRRSGMDPLPTV